MVGKPPVEDFYNGSTSQSRLVLAKPRLGAFGSSGVGSSSSPSKGSNPFASVLRPSQLKPGSNPFLKASDPSSDDAEKKDPENEKEPSEDRLKDKEEAEVPKFVPLGSANVTPRTSNPVPAPAQPTSSSSSTGFVFGQNLSERVVMKESVNNGDASSVDHSSSNGTTELLFTSAAASVKENQEEAGSSSGSNGPSSEPGLAAAAAEYERSHARPPPPAASYSLTGEEGEVNVLQISCRLFAWEAGSWRERGRGVLRLNDAEPGTGSAGVSRVVVRVAGSLRVSLNTAVWRGMVVERAGARSLRISATTDQQIKLFLIMGAPADIQQLYRALTARVAATKRTQAPPPSSAAERLEAEAEPAAEAEPETARAALPPPADDPPPELKPMKRKEPAEADTPPKRQCPDILVE